MTYLKSTRTALALLAFLVMRPARAGDPEAFLGSALKAAIATDENSIFSRWTPEAKAAREAYLNSLGSSKSVVLIRHASESAGAAIYDVRLFSDKFNGTSQFVASATEHGGLTRWKVDVPKWTDDATHLISFNYVRDSSAHQIGGVYSLSESFAGLFSNGTVEREYTVASVGAATLRVQTSETIRSEIKGTTRVLQAELDPKNARSLILHYESISKEAHEVAQQSALTLPPEAKGQIIGMNQLVSSDRSVPGERVTVYVSDGKNIAKLSYILHRDGLRPATFERTEFQRLEVDEVSQLGFSIEPPRFLPSRYQLAGSSGAPGFSIDSSALKAAP